MARSHRVKSLSPHIYSLNSKRICIYFSSPQEWPKCHFCDYKKVLEIVEGWIEKCVSNGCKLLIGAFSIRANQQGELNSNCITKPIEDLKSRGFKLHLVYLRKDSARHISQANDLISQCSCPRREITSDKNGERRQAAELLKIVMEVDP
jgi:hypothetical protein